MIAFYLDEDVTERLADLLITPGYDVTTTGRPGNKGHKDPQQLIIAANLNRVFVTTTPATTKSSTKHGANSPAPGASPRNRAISAS